MAAILTSNASVMAAENFITSIYDNDTNLYMGVGQGYQEGDSYSDTTTITTDGNETSYGPTETNNYDNMERWTDEYNPPVPSDRISNIKAFLDNLIGIKKINPTNVRLVVPRNNWERGKVYNVLSTEAISAKRAQDYYCLTTSEQGDNCVWVCIDKDETVETYNGTTNFEPTLSYEENVSNPVNEHEENIGVHLIQNNIVKCADGYTWMFLYNIPSNVVNSGLLLDNWMPVPFAHHGSDNLSEPYTSQSGKQIRSSGTLTDKQITYGDCNANRTLGAYRILVTCTLANEGTAIPYNSIYRQVGLLLDPRSSSLSSGRDAINVGDTTPETDNAYGVGTGNMTDTYSQFPQSLQGVRLKGERYSASEVDTRYGTAELMMGNPVQVIYLENKKPMMREESQSEKLEIILVF